MTQLTKQSAEQAVKQITSENIENHPYAWKFSGFDEEFAEQLWENRNEFETERDNEAEVALKDYNTWVNEILKRKFSENIEKAANHFIELYHDEIENENYNGNTIHEWWKLTVDQYPLLDFDDLDEIDQKIVEIVY